ncbi:MAG TPA: hypothetical protein EYN66_18200 [Myxococcales bacterium]|nr:hypothetical protein [Myxococcales bacterium]
MARIGAGTSAARTVPPAPVVAGGGGGGGNEWKDWIDLPLDPSDGWTITTAPNAANAGATVAKVGDELHFKVPNSGSMRIQGSQMNGLFMARSIHIKPWEDAGITKPAGATDSQYEPEAIQYKIEIEFATSNLGPISGGSVVGAEGTYLTCLVGLAGFPTDQGGNPVPSSDYRWSAAQVYKNYGGNPATDSRLNLYTSGYKSYSTNNGMQGTKQWKNQQNGGEAGSHNAIVYATSPLRKEEGSGPYGRSNIQAGSYDNTTPFAGMCTLNQQLFDNSTKFSMPMAGQSAPPFWHVALWFGTNTTTSGKGEIRIKKIRMYLQPVQNRFAL